jgi:hypothetical protein
VNSKPIKLASTTVIEENRPTEVAVRPFHAK